MKEPSVPCRNRVGTRFASWFSGALLLSSVIASLLHAQISEEDKKKRDAFLKAREEMHTIPSPTPSKSASPAAKPKPAKKKSKSGKAAVKDGEAEPTKTPAKKKQSDADDGSDTPRPKKKTTPAETAAPRLKSRSDEDQEETRATPRPRETVYPAARPDGSTPPPRSPVVVPPAVQQPPPDITIQKSGFEQEQGYEPPPPPPAKRSFWSRLFGGGGGSERNFRYLDRNVIAAIRNAPVQRSRWKFIIVHNSGTKQGNARAFDYYHRNVRHMQNGMAYHFVVGNGTSSGNGQVEVGDRWRRQINGGHVHSDYLNNISLGICLVGDFNRSQPTRAQLDATEELIKYLRDRCGRVEGHAIAVRPHREMNPPRWATDCPGDAFPYDWFKRF